MAVGDNCWRKGATGEVGEDRAEMVEADQGGERIVDPGRKGANGDFDEFEHARFEVVAP